MSSGERERDYKPVLVRIETKQRLRTFRRALAERDLNQERRLVTAAVETMLEHPELRAEWLARVHDVVRADLLSMAKEASAPAQPVSEQCSGAVNAAA